MKKTKKVLLSLDEAFYFFLKASYIRANLAKLKGDDVDGK